MGTGLQEKEEWLKQRQTDFRGLAKTMLYAAIIKQAMREEYGIEYEPVRLKRGNTKRVSEL